MSDQPPKDADDADLRRMYHSGAAEEPDAELDRRILAAAAAASARRSRKARLPWAAGGLASAAVVVLTVALVLNQGSGPPLPKEAPSAAPPPEPTAPQRPAADRTAPQALEGMRGMTEQRARPQASHPPQAARDQTREQAASEGLADPTGDIQEMVANTAGPGEDSVAYADPACPEAFEVPAGATLRAIEDGIEVRLEDDVFRVRCVDGHWTRQEAAEPNR